MIDATREENPIRLKAAAAIMGNHPEHVRALAKAGKLPAMQIGGSGRWYFFASELRGWMRSKMQMQTLAGGEACPSDGGKIRTVRPAPRTSTSPSKVCRDYANLLELNQIRKTPSSSPANTTTNDKAICGGNHGLVSVPAGSGKRRSSNG